MAILVLRHRCLPRLAIRGDPAQAKAAVKVTPAVDPVAVHATATVVSQPRLAATRRDRFVITVGASTLTAELVARTSTWRQLSTLEITSGHRVRQLGNNRGSAWLVNTFVHVAPGHARWTDQIQSHRRSRAAAVWIGLIVNFVRDQLCLESRDKGMLVCFKVIVINGTQQY